MRSVKIGILALYCLLFALFAIKDLEFGTEWDFADYSNGFIGFCAGTLSMLLVGACVLIPAKTRDISVTLDETTVKALVEVLKERENDTQEVEQDI